MKDYMLIFKGTSYETMNLSPVEMQQHMGKWFAWQEKMAADGVELKGGNALHTQTRKVTGAKRTVTDTASPETKELIGGFYIVSARDVEHATEIAQGYPDYDIGGTVEIREVMVFDN